MLELFTIWDGRDEAIPCAELIASLKELELERSDLEEVLTFDERTYGRASIRRRPHYEALILGWRSGQRSPIHDHLGSSCAVRVIEGRATETRFVKSPCGWLVPERSRTFAAGCVTGCRDSSTHQMANLEPPGHDLITLHVYSPPASHWQFYPLDATTLADHDRLIWDRPETVVVDFARDVGCEHVAIDPPLKERLSETTVVRKSRTQAVDLARKLLAPARTELSVTGMTTFPAGSTVISPAGDLPAVDSAPIHYCI
jgi:cysteine dioxygenase